ncbi:unnamed protein product [Calypogeia fissa]
MSNEDVTVSARLDQARLFIRKAYSKIDPELPALLEVLEEVGASECWHKHSTFFDHLHNVYRTLKLWNCPDSIARCGLFHSSYSNSYVNLAIFEPNVDRQKVRDLIGQEAEELVHWFCIVPRQELIFDLLVYKYSEEEVGLWTSKRPETLGKAANDKRKVLLPPEGILVKHIRTGEDLLVPRRLIAIFLILTIADFSDQWYGWQDSLFGNANGNMEFSANDGSPLWPGDGKPGLWMPAISRMGLIVSQILRDEEEYQAAEKEQGRELDSRPFSNIEIRAPPILKHCTEIVSASDQVQCQNLYLEALCKKGDGQGHESAKSSLVKAIQYVPYLAEPHIVLAQILLTEGKWEEAQEEASEGLKLLLEWGTQWDKKMSWEGWIAWARVLKMNAEQKTWPKSGWGIINLGLVK